MAQTFAKPKGEIGEKIMQNIRKGKKKNSVLILYVIEMNIIELF